MSSARGGRKADRATPFPTGYQGLPQHPVALGERVMDALAEQYPVLRKYNILCFVLDHFQHRQTGAFADPEIARLIPGKASRSW